MTTHSHSATSFYSRLGGQQAVRQLVETFYDIVETSADGKPLMTLHLQGNGLAHARHAQFEFLSGFLGGPQLYFEHHHHANLKRIHEHLPIGLVERDAWLQCMDAALFQTDTEEELHKKLMDVFNRVAHSLLTVS